MTVPIDGDKILISQWRAGKSRDEPGTSGIPWRQIEIKSAGEVLRECRDGEENKKDDRSDLGHFMRTSLTANAWDRPLI